jgi:hypothetical protein
MGEQTYNQIEFLNDRGEWVPTTCVGSVKALKDRLQRAFDNGQSMGMDRYRIVHVTTTETREVIR